MFDGSEEKMVRSFVEHQDSQSDAPSSSCKDHVQILDQAIYNIALNKVEKQPEVNSRPRKVEVNCDFHTTSGELFERGEVLHLAENGEQYIRKGAKLGDEVVNTDRYSDLLTGIND